MPFERYEKGEEAKPLPRPYRKPKRIPLPPVPPEQLQNTLASVGLPPLPVVAVKEEPVLSKPADTVDKVKKKVLRIQYFLTNFRILQHYLKGKMHLHN